MFWSGALGEGQRRRGGGLQLVVLFGVKTCHRAPDLLSKAILVMALHDKDMVANFYDLFRYFVDYK